MRTQRPAILMFSRGTIVRGHFRTSKRHIVGTLALGQDGISEIEFTFHLKQLKIKTNT